MTISIIDTGASRLCGRQSCGAVTTAQTAGTCLPDFFSSLHGPAKTATLGMGLALFASMFYFSATNPNISVHNLLISIFLFLTTPVSTHLMAKGACT
ncbi:MAG TPA: monovalent cation/H(+) antiporter subunit G [Gammaproteobacteria bacterium]|nr:monovalent cation/H(+) antiporter subunit G [Gammaproteobacteria bacterium]